MKQVMDGEQNGDPSILTRYPQPIDDMSSNENERLRSRPFEQGVSWNPYSDYTAAHYNYYPATAIAGYPTQQDERYVAYTNQPDERDAAYPHPDKQYVAYPQHNYYESLTYRAQIAPPLVYSQSGKYFPYYSSRNEHSKGVWTTEHHVSGHHSDQFQQNRNSSISNMYQEPDIPFPSPINAGQYESHNEYPADYSERLHSARKQNESPQQVSSRSYHPAYEYSYEYTPHSESGKRLPDDVKALDVF